MSKPTEQSTITAVLRRIDLKVRFNQALYHLSVASCLVLGVLVLVEVAPLLVPVGRPPDSLIIGAGSAAFLALLIWTQIGGRRLEHAAGVADTRAGLNDELKSAYWFMRQDDSSPWIDLLVGRAARTARRLDPRGLVPVAIPKRFGLGALGLFALLQLLAFVPSSGPLLTFTAPSDSVRFERAREAFAEEIRDLIDGEGDEILDEEALAFLEKALEELQAAETSFDELLRDLREAQDALDEGNLEMTATRDALEELGEELAGSNELAEFVNALRNQDLSDAADLLRELAERLGDLSSQELADLGDRLQEASELDEAVIDQLLQALQEAADALSEERLSDAQEALDQVADALERLSDRQSRQEANNEAADRAEALQEALAQQRLGAEGQTQAQRRQGQSAGAQQAASMAMPSSAVNRSEGAQRSGTQTGPAGNATGDPSGAELELGASTTLEAQLALEVIEGEAPEAEQDPELDPEDLFQEASRQQAAIVQYRDVRAPSRYAEGSALNAERIPWRYRSLVKKYFLSIAPPPHRAPGRFNFGQAGSNERK